MRMGSTNCNVAVSKSAVKTSGGSMHFNADGTFTSSLTIYPKYHFNCGNGNVHPRHGKYGWNGHQPFQHQRHVEPERSRDGG